MRHPIYIVQNRGAVQRASAGKMADRMYGHPREGVLDLGKGAVSEKTPQIFRPLSPAEFMTLFSG